jgi:hypothetical protein
VTSYVVYKASKESKDRSIIPHRLKALGCKRLHEAFWKFNEDKTYKVLKALKNNQPIFLKRTREIKKPQFTKNKGLSELGSLVVVMYATPQDVKREKIKRLLSRAPCIRLRRSVYAFLQKHSLFDKDRRLVDARRFVDFIDQNNGHVRAIPRVVIEDADSIDRLLEETRARVENRLGDIITSCKELCGRALRGDDLRLARDLLAKSKREFVTLKRVATFYEKWLGIDFSSSLRRAYKAIKRVSSVINERQVTKLENVSMH